MSLHAKSKEVYGEANDECELGERLAGTDAEQQFDSKAAVISV